MKLDIKVNLSFWLSILAILLSVVSICLQCPRIGTLDFDYAGIIVGIFSLLVTVLIAWQISSMIGIDRHFEKIASDKIDETLQSFEQKNEILQEIFWWNNVQMQLLSKNYSSAFLMGIKGLDIATTKEGKNRYREIIINCYADFKQHIDEVDNEDLKVCLNILKKYITEYDSADILQIIVEMSNHTCQHD